MKNLNTVLITGASEGIGRSFAETFAEKGHDLVLVARNKDLLNALAEELIRGFGIKVSVIAMDLIPHDAADTLFHHLAKEQIEVDVLVNNAGMMQVETFCSSDQVTLNNLMQLNIVSLVNLARLFSGPMLARGKGAIVNVGSVASFMPTPQFTVYGASKAFVLSFTEGLSQELKGTGVTATCVCPGFTKTNMLSQGHGVENYIPAFMKATPSELTNQAYNAIGKGEVVFLDSLANKALVQWASHYPRWFVRGVNGLLGRFSQ